MQISNSLAGIYSPPVTSQNPVQTPAAAPTSSNSPLGTAGDAAEQAFLDYMKETPAQKLEDQWLAAHHLTRKQLDAMSPQQREAILKEMEADIEQQLKQQTTKKTGTKTDLLV
jgi:hypothetical protein